MGFYGAARGMRHDLRYGRDIRRSAGLSYIEQSLTADINKTQLRTRDACDEPGPDSSEKNTQMIIQQAQSFFYSLCARYHLQKIWTKAC